jgi:hypothetical protein
MRQVRALSECWQLVTGLHESVVQPSASSQLMAPPTQVPDWHWSDVVHTLLSLQGVVLATGEWVQPLPVLQPSLVQEFPSSQFTPLPVHTPLWQESPDVHALLSVQPVPLGMGTWEHPVMALQLSAVQKFRSSQFTVPDVVHVPPWQESPVVQTLPSLQVLPLGSGE